MRSMLRSMQHAASRAPGPGLGAALGWVLRFRGDPLGVLREATARYGDVVRVQVGPRIVHFFARPDHVAHVLRTNADNYARGKKLKMVFRDGLIATEGALWKSQRKALQPIFTPAALGQLVPSMVRTARKGLREWADAQRRDGSVELGVASTNLALDVVGESLFGVDIRDGATNLMEPLHYLQDFVTARAKATASLPLWVPAPSHFRFRANRRRFEQLVEKLAARVTARTVDAGATGLLPHLIALGEELMPPHLLRDQLMTFFMAGFETTANALLWTLWQIARHPEVQRRIHSELDDVLGGESVTEQALGRLEYLRMVICEGMRLYPPSWFIMRWSIERDVVAGYEIPPGTIALTSQFITHRDPRFWPDPERFDPERFRGADESTNRSRGYFPFGVGRHTCIGIGFAQIELQVMMAELLAQHWLEVVDPDHRPGTICGITLRPDSPVRLRLLDRPRVLP